MEADVMDLLTQGSVWKKNEGQKAGNQVKLLFLTNTTLPERVREKHPIQVIYADEQNRVYNRPVDQFTQQFTFHNVDGDLETRLEALLVFNEDDYDDEEEGDDDQEVSVSEEPLTASQSGLVNKPMSFADSLLDGEDEPTPVDQADIESDADFTQTVVQFTMTHFSPNQAALDDADLSASLVAYSQEPDIENSRIKHRLLFALSDVVSIGSLKDAFYPSEVHNTVDMFAVVGPQFAETVQWTDYMGVYPEMAQGRAFATVLLGEQIPQEPQVEEFEPEPVEENPVQDVEFTEPQTQVVIEPVVESQPGQQPEVQPEAPQEQPQATPAAQQFVQNLVQNIAPHNPHNPHPPEGQQ